MDCKQCRERLHDFLDETLEAAERAQVSAHAADCAACRRELEQLRKAAALVSSLDELPEPDGFLQAVRERIARPTLWERFEGLLSRPLRPGVSVGIPVIIVAFVAVFVVMNLPPRSPQRFEKANGPKGEETVDVAYGLEEKPSSPGAEDARSFVRRKTGPSEEAAEPVDGVWAKGGRGAGAKEDEEKALADADSISVEKAGAADGAAKGAETAGEPEVETQVVSRDVTEGTQLDRTRVAEQRAREGTTTTAGADTTDTREESDKDEEADLAETELAEAEEAEGEGAGGEEAEQVANGALFIGGLAGPRGDAKARPLGDEEVIQFVVFDLPTDLSNVQKIAAEEGAQVVEQRKENALTGIVVQVPADNYARAVERFYYYNAVNVKAIEQEKDLNQDQTIRNNRAAQLAKGQQRQGWLKPLPLIVQRIVKKTTADEE